MTNKDIILQTALQLFGDQGYDRTSTSSIAHKAGVSEGLIFRHFGSKAGLLAAIIEAGMQQIAATMQPYNTATDPREAIIMHIDNALSSIREHQSFWRLATQIRFQAGIQDVVGEQINMVNQFIIKQLQDNFQRLGVPRPEQEALALFALIDGVCLHWLQSPGQYPLELMRELLIEKYKHP